MLTVLAAVAIAMLGCFGLLLLIAWPAIPRLLGAVYRLAARWRGRRGVPEYAGSHRLPTGQYPLVTPKGGAR